MSTSTANSLSSSAQALIRAAYQAAQAGQLEATPELTAALKQTLALLDQGQIRVAEPSTTGWQVNPWIKEAVLLSFRLQANQHIPGQPAPWYDKVPLKYANYTAEDFDATGVRAVPPTTVRYGAYIAPGTILMPAYVNIGAYVGAGTLIDTWATVGSCAQIGQNVHISGGVGIGGVLEPVQAAPTIIEDDCFIGARSEIVEGVVVEQGAIISMGVFIGQSTKIYNRATGEVSYGRVPKGAVVVPGSLPSQDGRCNLNCAIIVKQVDAQTRAKTSLNDLLRDGK